MMVKRFQKASVSKKIVLALVVLALLALPIFAVANPDALRSVADTAHELFASSEGRSQATAVTNSEQAITPLSDAITVSAAHITKVLRVPEEVPNPDLTFTFLIERYSFNGDTSQAHQLPQIGTVVDGIGTMQLSVNAANGSPVTSEGVTTLTRTVNMLEGIEFDRVGTFVWHISEQRGSSDSALPSLVTYSQALYELRVEISYWAGPGSSLRADVNLMQLTSDGGSTITSPEPGFPMYAWGSNGNGQLGLGHRTNQHTPRRVGTGVNWIQATTATGGSFAINAEGHLYAWGNYSDNPNMGQGDSGLPQRILNVPTRVGTASNWVAVSARSQHVVARNAHGHIYMWGTPAQADLGPALNVPTRVGTASNWSYVVTTSHNVFAINNQGHLFSKGGNQFGELGRTGVNRGTLVRVGTGSDWINVAGGGTRAMAGVTASGHLYTWGSNPSGLLGLGVSGNRVEPTRVGTATNWLSVTVTSGEGAMIALTSDGELFSWGSTAGGQLGRNADAANPNNVPGQIGTATNWLTLMSANSHVLAFNDLGELWGWGANGAGQLGLGAWTPSFHHSPVRVLQTDYFSAAAYGGGHHSIMLLRSDAGSATFTNSYEIVQVNLVKTLELASSATLPTPPPSFEFAFEPTQVQVQLNPPIQSRPVADLAGLVTSPQSVTIDPTTGSGTPRTYTGYIDLWDLFDNVDFPSGGVFAWNISEVSNSSGTSLPYIMEYDESRFQVWVWVNQDGSLHDIRIFPISEAENGNNGDYTLEPKVPYIGFRNLLSRQIDQTLEITKQVTGRFAYYGTDFIFDLVLTHSDASVSIPSPIVANIYYGTNTTPVRTVTITGGQSPQPGGFILRHNERLVVPNLPMNTTFNVTERAHLSFRPDVTVYIGGVNVWEDDAGFNTSLPTGNRVLSAAEGRNAADFTNTFELPPPETGLFILGDIPLLIFVIPVIGLVAYMVLRNRKTIERLPL